MKTETTSPPSNQDGTNWENLLELWNDRIQKYRTLFDSIPTRFRTINVNHTQTSSFPFPLHPQDQSACLLLLITLTFNHPSLLNLLDNTLYCHMPRTLHPALTALLPLLLDVSTRMETKTQLKHESEENQVDELGSVIETPQSE